MGHGDATQRMADFDLDPQQRLVRETVREFAEREIAPHVELCEREARYPCVLKPSGLSASRGVIRADDRTAFVDAFERIAAILGRPEIRRKGGDTLHLIVEEYLPGEEVALTPPATARQVLALEDDA